MLCVEAASSPPPDPFVGLYAGQAGSSLGSVIRAFSTERLIIFLKYIRDWNTKLRYRPLAQQLLSVVLRSYPPSVISELPDIKVVIFQPLPRCTLTHNPTHHI